MEKMKPVNKGNGLWGCTECTYEHEEKGSVRLHHYWTHGAGVGKKKPKKEVKVKHVCAWRLLDPRQENEAAAIAQGYTKVCEECFELG
jgi:hypothetical protein